MDGKRLFASLLVEVREITEGYVEGDWEGEAMEGKYSS
jgi:hypothetical protein